MTWLVNPDQLTCVTDWQQCFAEISKITTTVD
jgi:hypothetical protein